MAVDLRLLRYFVAVAEELHFGQAADRLHISQPSLSRAIRDLEGSLGAQLFTRTRRRVRLTDAGRHLLEETPRLLGDVERVLAETRRVGHGELGSLSIAFLPSATAVLMPRLIRAFRAAYPDVQLEVEEMLDEPQLEALRSRRIHVGIVRSRVDDAELSFERLLSDTVCAALPSGHRLAGRAELTYADLADEDFLLWAREESPEGYDMVMSSCREAGFSPRIVHEVGTTAYTILALVAGGLGISILSSSLRDLRGDDVVFVPLKGGTSQIYVVWRNDADSAACVNFVATARHTAQHLQRPRSAMRRRGVAIATPRR
jgi:DNA-binding transcriptional LysR family regulator